MQNKNRRKNFFLPNLLWLPGIYLFLLKSVRIQKRFIRIDLEPELKPFRRENDGSLTEAHFKKIISYYAMGVPAILGESHCILRGSSMTKEERQCMSYLGGISGLLDDLFDEPGKSAEHLQDFIYDPKSLIPKSTHESLLKHLYMKGLSYHPDPNQIKRVAHKVFKAQQRSLEQTGSVSSERIAELTFLKGGNSFIYYRLCLFHKLDEMEEKMVYQLGALLQLGNDIFDIWEDTQEGIATIATTTTNINELRVCFKLELEKVYDMAIATKYEPDQKKRFYRMINMAIARVFVCLDQFEALESTTGGKFLPENYTRTQLICDMQKPRNHLKAIWYYLKMPQNQ